MAAARPDPRTDPPRRPVNDDTCPWTPIETFADSEANEPSGSSGSSVLIGEFAHCAQSESYDVPF